MLSFGLLCSNLTGVISEFSKPLRYIRCDLRFPETKAFNENEISILIYECRRKLGYLYPIEFFFQLFDFVSRFSNRQIHGQNLSESKDDGEFPFGAINFFHSLFRVHWIISYAVHMLQSHFTVMQYEKCAHERIHKNQKNEKQKNE